jgi:radical SAM superfamily enzyme YgiQ (UPF0313 family)
MRPLQVLLVNPPIFDFTAYDFWLRPYGMLRVAGQMRHYCRLSFFDFLVSKKKDAWGRGSFDCQDIAKPKTLYDIPRKFHRFGKPRSEFRDLLFTRTFDAVLIQTYMTYWYPGIHEVIEDIRQLQPSAKVVLGGVYATLCQTHARSLEADLAVKDADLEPLWRLLSVVPEKALPHWPRGYADVGILKITEGCPFHCTYCAAPLLGKGFVERPTADCLNELQLLVAEGAKNVAFYDDALLHHADRGLVPFLKTVMDANIKVSFHTPNALNARIMTPELARLMVRAGFVSFFFGLESCAPSWQSKTGDKVHSEEFSAAVEQLRAAGAKSIVTYVIVGHPDSEIQGLESSIHFAHLCGTRVMLSEFSPIPGTIDGNKSQQWADLDEPLSHNKTAFAIRRLGTDRINGLKQLCHSLNAKLKNAANSTN